MARSTRTKTTQPLYADGDDSGNDTEPDTPRPVQSRSSKKRLSEANRDGSFNEDSGAGRAPLRSVNMNDDAAEKRRRRKSTKPAPLFADEDDEPQAGPSNSAQADGNGPALASGRSLQRLRSVAQVPALDVPIDVNNYEEWMKMATDNVSRHISQLR
jgi:condensin complex subunit 2